MGLNIKNERTASVIRELARRTGQSQTAAVEDAVRLRLAELDRESDTAGHHGDRAMAQRLLQKLRGSITDEERAAVRTADAQLYDDGAAIRSYRDYGRGSGTDIEAAYPGRVRGSSGASPE